MIVLGLVNLTLERRQVTGNLELGSSHPCAMTASFANGNGTHSHTFKSKKIGYNCATMPGMDQEWSFWGVAQNDNTPEITLALQQQHEKPCDEVALPNNDEEFERILQHLERIEGSVKDLKARVDDAKLRIEQSEQEYGVLPRCDDDDQAPASLSSPVMEKMGRAPYKLSGSPPQLPEVSEPVMEERDLHYSPPLAETIGQDMLSFRVWEQEAAAAAAAAPKRKRRSRRAALDLETALDLVAEEYAKSNDLKLPLPNSGLGRFCVNIPKDDGDDVVTDDAAATSTENDKEKLNSPPNVDALLSLRALDLRSRRTPPKVEVDVDVDVEFEARRCEETESQDFNPSPSSFTCGLSPTSLFSDDQEPFQVSVLSDENLFLKNFQPFSGKSPRSVLSTKDEEPDEISRSTSDCSEEEEDCPLNAASFCAYLYNDESSDLESPMKTWTVGGNGAGIAHRPFLAFTYNVAEEMGATSSSEEDEDEEDEDEEDDEDGSEARDATSTTSVATSSTSVADLGFFQEAAKRNQWEPCLVRDNDGVLDDSDLEFLLSPDLKIIEKTSPLGDRDQKRTPSRVIDDDEEEETVEQKSNLGESPRTWVPYVTGSDGSPGGSRRHVTDSEAPVGGGGEKKSVSARKRTVNFAADLVKEIPHSPEPSIMDKKPAPNPRAKSVNVRRDSGDESVVQEEEGPSIMTSRRRWRRNRVETSGSPDGSSPTSWHTRSGSRRRRVVLCAGQLCSCSWPQRLLFKVSRGKGRVESDEERFNDDGSFGTSARRDAEQVRRILKGSQKRYSNLTVDEIMKEDFGK